MDIDTMAACGHEIREKEKAARDAKTEFAIEEFEDNFDELFARVENGETLAIIHTTGQKVLMVPTTCLTGCIPKNVLNSEQNA